MELKKYLSDISQYDNIIVAGPCWWGTYPCAVFSQLERLDFSGKKVFPEEVEAILEKSQYIAEVCVLGTSRTFGSKDGTEEVTAVIVPKSDLYDSMSEEELDSVIRADVKGLSNCLAQYKRPTNVIIRKAELPKTTTRKVKRNELRELIKV